MRMKIPQGVPHLSLAHLDLGRASCPSSGAEWSGPVSLLIIMVMIDENFFSTLLHTGDVGESAVDCHLLCDSVSFERAVDKSCGGVKVPEVKKIKSSQLHADHPKPVPVDGQKVVHNCPGLLAPV